jgi:hypothetical protein
MSRYRTGTGVFLIHQRCRYYRLRNSDLARYCHLSLETVGISLSKNDDSGRNRLFLAVFGME